MSRSVPQLLNRDVARRAAIGLALLRAAIGAVAVVVPARALGPWVGKRVASKEGGELLGRSLGARDLALGAGALLSVRHDTPVRGWVEAGALADLGDLVATTIAFKELPSRTRWGVLALTVGAVVAGAVLAPCVDGDSGRDRRVSSSR